ncbi:MAG: hypothetical protein GY866_39660 [Proteobacteria bacterium]|nr:hypothetical protein [Pseudomonadota bacterium]
MVVVCVNYHTATDRALGAIARHGISEVEQIPTAQTLMQANAKTLSNRIDGKFSSAKDTTLAIIGKIGTTEGTGQRLEFPVQVIECLAMAGRTTIWDKVVKAEPGE